MLAAVRVQGREVRLTESGWKSGDPVLDRACDSCMQTGLGGFQWDPDPNKAQAEKLAAALGGTVISIAAPLKEEIPPGAVM